MVYSPSYYIEHNGTQGLQPVHWHILYKHIILSEHSPGHIAQGSGLCGWNVISLVTSLEVCSNFTDHCNGW